jgi:hypothetical protein
LRQRSAFSTRSTSRSDIMELKLKFIDDKGKESGVCHVHKVVDGELKRIGEIKYSDQGDRRWILDVVKFQSSVSILD